ncbi:hypothetical protein FB192DRAFT_1455388 [Mucor lusitanicus]|nr:hypothetical protein FB192DRAFT_1455388 [Mucor lusitanicus]
MVFSAPEDYLKGGERTLFSEVFIQQFKNSGKMTKLLQFVWWIEKKMPNIDHSWLMAKNNINFIMLESSGVVEEIFKHTLEDTTKNLKHGTELLASMLCSYRSCNINTVKRIVVLTGHIIGNKLTIIKYSCGNSQKWSACEVRLCEVPLTFESRKATIKLFEVFAYIYLTLKEQEKVYDQLADEKLGLVNVEEMDKAQNSQCFL